jgi:hypothetical protein
VVVVVGGLVVVVVGGDVVVVVVVGLDGVPDSDGGVVETGEVVGVVVVVVGGDVVVVEGGVSGTVWDVVLAPGCSFAATTPIAMVAPVATMIAERVRRRRRASARRRDSGEFGGGVALIDCVFWAASFHGSQGGLYLPEGFLWLICEK